MQSVRNSQLIWYNDAFYLGLVELAKTKRFYKAKCVPISTSIFIFQVKNCSFHIYRFRDTHLNVLTQLCPVSNQGVTFAFRNEVMKLNTDRTKIRIE